jgi:hypothetical protein
MATVAAFLVLCISREYGCVNTENVTSHRSHFAFPVQLEIQRARPMFLTTMWASECPRVRCA